MITPILAFISSFIAINLLIEEIATPFNNYIVNHNPIIKEYWILSESTSFITSILVFVASFPALLMTFMMTSHFSTFEEMGIPQIFFIFWAASGSIFSKYYPEYSIFLNIIFVILSYPVGWLLMKKIDKK